MKSINELCCIISGGTPKTSNPSYWNGSIPWISIKDFISSNRYVLSTEKTISENGLQNSVTHLLEPGDIIMSARGTVGKVAIVSRPMAFNQSCFGLRAKNPNELNQKYLYYWLLSKREYIQTGSHGAVFDTITRNDFNRILIDLPSISTQQHIIDTTSSLQQEFVSLFLLISFPPPLI